LDETADLAEGSRDLLLFNLEAMPSLIASTLAARRGKRSFAASIFFLTHGDSLERIVTPKIISGVPGTTSMNQPTTPRTTSVQPAINLSRRYNGALFRC
jgi:hypothetical protein